MIFQHDFCARDGVGFAGQQAGSVVVGFLFLDWAVKGIAIAVSASFGAEGYLL